MPEYSFSQSEADTILFSVYAVLQESGYSGPAVINSVDTDTYVVAAAIFTETPCIKRESRKQSYAETLCSSQSVKVSLTLKRKQLRVYSPCYLW